MADKSRKKNKDMENSQAESPQTEDVVDCKIDAEEVCAESEKLAEKLAAQEDAYLRLRAEYDNYRKRTQKEREGIYALAASEVVCAFLPVVDNMERACAQENADEGVKMICKQLCDILDKYGVKSVGLVGEAFDPGLHNAVAHEGEGGAGESRIAEVLQKGYQMGDRLIRPAMVKTEN